MAKNRAKKDWLNKENIIFLWLGRVSKTRGILSENGRPGIFTENERFPAKTGGLESLRKLKLVTLRTNGRTTMARVR